MCAAVEDLWHAEAVDIVYTAFPEEALRRAMRSSRKAGQGLRAERAPSRPRGKLALVSLRFTLHARLRGPARDPHYGSTTRHPARGEGVVESLWSPKTEYNQF